MTIAPGRPGPVVVMAFIVTLAGRFTLSRAGVDIPIVNDVRVPLFFVLLLCLALEAHRMGPHPVSGGEALLGVLALLGYQGLSALWVPPGTPTGPVVGDLCAVAGLLVVYYTLANWDRDQVTGTTLVLFQVTAWIYFLAAASGRGHAPGNRWAALGGGPNVFVRLMILGVISSIYLYLRSGDRLIWLVPIPAFLFGAIASGSRGGIAALGITAGVALLAIRPKLDFDRLAKPLGLLLVVGAVLVITAGPYIAGFVQSRFVEATIGEGYASQRDVLFRMALRIFLQRPILGTGVSGFYTVTDLGPGEKYVHNLPLATAAEGGFVGLALLTMAWLGLWHAYIAVPKPERSLESRTAAYCGIFIGGASLFSGDYYDARLMWILLLLASVRPAHAPVPSRR
ncbi:O-antigen ligase family protein [Actinoplanes oblitus]|uniref:O-antigen ligase family protein n=1 Tax=Actinoplanes oblitus TaxID=3040509 RepID=A0ABY8WCJ1_9ACTN|nr:O-antigen ligase family protein [Actinoplanes oblitus]WIM94124.1 O-antigen ligase family protein [Actinoplanes oblitus]